LKKAIEVWDYLMEEDWVSNEITTFLPL
jgi:hypothetical protein